MRHIHLRGKAQGLASVAGGYAWRAWVVCGALLVVGCAHLTAARPHGKCRYANAYKESEKLEERY